MTAQLVEFYRSYEPPAGMRPAAEALLSRLPPRYLLGLGSVVLRDTESLSAREKRGKTWSRAKKAGGRGVRLMEVLDLPLVLEVALGMTLFHELGHHLHVTQAREHREREAVAEKWRRKLTRDCFGRWYLVRRYWRVPTLLFAGMSRGNRWGFSFLLERPDVWLMAMPFLLPILPIALIRWTYRKLRRPIRAALRHRTGRGPAEAIAEGHPGAPEGYPERRAEAPAPATLAARGAESDRSSHIARTSSERGGRLSDSTRRRCGPAGFAAHEDCVPADDSDGDQRSDRGKRDECADDSEQDVLRKRSRATVRADRRTVGDEQDDCEDDRKER